MGKSFFEVSGGSSSTNPQYTVKGNSEQAKLVSGNDIASIFQNGLKMLAQNTDLTENALSKEILEALTKAASNGNGEGFSYSINSSDNTEVVESGIYKGSKEDKIENDKTEDDRNTTSNNSNDKNKTQKTPSLLEQFVKILQQLMAQAQKE